MNNPLPANSKSDLPDPQTPAPRKRRIYRTLSLIVVAGAIVFWQRSVVLGIPLRMKINQSIQARDLANAVWWTDLARQLLPQDARMALLAARVARHQGNMQLVGTELKNAASLGASPESLQREQWLALAQSGQMRQAAPHLSQLLTDRNHDNEEVCHAFVLGYLRTNRTDAALSLLNAWISDAPSNATPYFIRARVYQLLSGFADAEKDFLKAVELEPDWVLPALELAELLVSRKRYSDAELWLQKLKPDGFEADSDLIVRHSIALSECRLASGDSSSAVVLLEQACRTEPDSLDAHVALGRSLLEVGRYEDSIRSLLRALELRPGYDETHYLISQAYSMTGQQEKATGHVQFVSTAREALQELDGLNAELLQNADDAEKLIRAGEILLQYGDPDEGVLRILAGLDLTPQDKKALRLLAGHYSHKAKNDPAYQKLSDDFQDRLKKAAE